MSKQQALWFPLRGPWRRVIYVVVFEMLAIFLVALVLLLAQQSMLRASGLAVGNSVIAVIWNYIFNAGFERWEARLAHPARTVGRRILHSLCFELGLIVLLVPFMAWWLDISLWQSLLLEAGFMLFFLIYTFVYTLVFDKLFGLPGLLPTKAAPV